VKIVPSISSSWRGALPVVAETWDGWLNDIGAFAVEKEHLYEAMNNAKDGPVEEGNVGGGTGMICHEFKGGIGTSSRRITTRVGVFTIGALVQANYGLRQDLRIDGVPIGIKLATQLPLPPRQAKDGSIIVILATDAPLLPDQCTRLAKRATVGMARVGGNGLNGSGDIFLAFSTGNKIPVGPADRPLEAKFVPADEMDGLFVGAAEAVEEAILNALCAAETMVGFQGRMIEALPVEIVKDIMGRYRTREQSI